MSTPTGTTKNDYILLFRGKDWDQGLSPDEVDQVIEKLSIWMDGLREAGKVKGGQPLAREGRFVSGKNGRTVADGPFAEAKETVGGYLLVQVEDLDEALAIAKACPTLDLGVTIEVRPVLEECPIFQRVKARLAVAAA